MTSTVVEPGRLVWVRGEHWVVSRVDVSAQPVDELAARRLPGRTLVTLMNVSGDDLGEELTVVWEIEPGHEVISQDALPEVTADGWDDPQRLGAFLDAARWGTVASADPAHSRRRSDPGSLCTRISSNPLRKRWRCHGSTS